ncbi:MAG: Rpn family recombination-promoting nuclease/putative transposase [Planctomycetaceae bacterium]|nr:Rpn family recombination-promoting nuclease/putative transposase [Planctomycetaceae bacterium]
MAKDDPIITPTTDLFIASLWSAPKNEPILCSLLSGVMTDCGQPPVAKATVLNPFNIQEYAIDKRIILDVRVEDAKGTFYNVEVQKVAETDFLERMLYGWAETYGSQLLWGEGYEELCPVRSIIITEFPIFPSLKWLHAVFELRARENPDVLFSDHCQMHVLRLGDLLRNKLAGLDQLGLDLQRWMQLWIYGSKLEDDKMSTMLEDSPAVLQAYEEFKRFVSDPVMRERVRARERFLNDERLKIGGARREGRAEGRAEEKIETAQNLKRLGVPITTISEATGLSVSEIERLG